MDEGLIELFISYSHRDEALRQQLDKHLMPLQRQKVISTWHDRKIGAGQEWAKEIDDNLSKAHIILLLISPDFIASDYCYDIELEQALQRHERGEAIVVPIIVEPCDWKLLPFGKLQAFPTDGKAITTWSNQNEAFLDVSKGIRAVAQQLQQQQRKLLSQGNLSFSTNDVTNSSQEQYRQQVRDILTDGEISDIGLDILEHLREELNLSPEIATQILNQELELARKPQRNRQSYLGILQKAMDKSDPLTPSVDRELKIAQQNLGISDTDADYLKQELLNQRENLWQQIKQQIQHLSYDSQTKKYSISYNPTLWEQLNALPDDLRSEKNIDYSPLRDLLKADQWDEADRETNRVIMRVANQKSERWLDKESIDNFPCVDLGTIDQLWVKYSQGHFGFSVQKQIWLKCGGKVDDATENKLEDELGWRIGGKWRFHIARHLNTSVLAYLPRRAVNKSVGWLEEGFFSRIRICNI